MKDIHGYRLVSDLKPDKSGFAKWGFATRNGREFFIKEFLSPIYPIDTSVLSPAQVQSKRNICNKFDIDKRLFYSELNKCLNGNVVTVCDFFRHESRFYMITEKINAVNFSPEQVCSFSLAQKVLIAKVILHSVAMLHNHGIVHGDIKADNILFKQTPLGVYTAKLIDFDSSFFEARPYDSNEDFQGDMVYFAPESFLYIAEENTRPTCKIDIFALGVLFHQYFSGKLPLFDKSKYAYAFEAILDGGTIGIDRSIPPFVAGLIRKMLHKNPTERPGAVQLFNYLQYYCDNPKAKIEDIDLSYEEKEGAEDKSFPGIVAEPSGKKYDVLVYEPIDTPQGDSTPKNNDKSGGDIERNPQEDNVTTSKSGLIIKMNTSPGISSEIGTCESEPTIIKNVEEEPPVTEAPKINKPYDVLGGAKPISAKGDSTTRDKHFKKAEDIF
ncbi:MAG: protein kinase [Clostridia bacterium]|nr:protein kinase [Clostridia bacterium]